MLQILKRFFKGRPKVNYAELVKKGAVILDVRTQSEYSSGHIKGSKHISIDVLDKQLGQLPDKTKPVITVCASGVRSAAAASLLKASGYHEVYNGGAWSDLKERISA